MTYRLARTMCTNRLVAVGSRVWALRLLLFMKCVKRADSMTVPGGWPCSVTSPSAGVTPSYPACYLRKSSVHWSWLWRMDMRLCRNVWGRACHGTAYTVAQRCHIPSIHLHLALHLLRIHPTYQQEKHAEFVLGSDKSKSTKTFRIENKFTVEYMWLSNGLNLKFITMK